MMTQRGYEQLAHTLAEGYEDILQAESMPTAVSGMLIILLRALKEDNGRFDGKKFMQAFWDEVNRISSVKKGE